MEAQAYPFSLVFGAGDAHMHALMTFYEKNVKQPFAVIDVDGVAGAGYGNEKRRVETYRELAEQVVKLIRKRLSRMICLSCLNKRELL